MEHLYKIHKRNFFFQFTSSFLRWLKNKEKCEKTISVFLVHFTLFLFFFICEWNVIEVRSIVTTGIVTQNLRRSWMTFEKELSDRVVLSPSKIDGRNSLLNKIEYFGRSGSFVMFQSSSISHSFKGRNFPSCCCIHDSLWVNIQFNTLSIKILFTHLLF